MINIYAKVPKVSLICILSREKPVVMLLVNCLLNAKKLFSQSCLRNLMSESDYVTQWKFLKRRTAYLCGHLKCLFKVNESHLRQTRKHRKSQVYNEIIIMYAFAQRSIFSMFYERRRSVFLYNSWASYLFDSVRSTKLAIRRFVKRFVSYRIGEQINWSAPHQ